MFTLACPFCDNKINSVEKNTIPMFTKEKDHTPLQVHTLKFPACPFIQGTKLGTKLRSRNNLFTPRAYACTGLGLHLYFTFANECSGLD